jgi:hypothetical protein
VPPFKSESYSRFAVRRRILCASTDPYNAESSAAVHLTLLLDGGATTACMLLGIQVASSKEIKEMTLYSAKFLLAAKHRAQIES